MSEEVLLRETKANFNEIYKLDTAIKVIEISLDNKAIKNGYITYDTTNHIISE